MKGRFGAMAAVGVCMALVASAVQANQIEDEMKDAASGNTRMRAGFLFSVAVQSSKSKYQPTPKASMAKMANVVLEPGAYLLLNPIRDWVEFEFNVSYKLNLLDNPEAGRTAKYAVDSVPITAGVLFRLDKGAVGVGAYKDVWAKASFYEGTVQDSIKVDGSVGAYLEYQVNGKGKDERGICYSRLYVGKSSLEGVVPVDDANYGLSLGCKY